MKHLGFLFVSKESWSDVRWARKQWLAYYLAQRNEVGRVVYVDRHRSWWRREAETPSRQEGKVRVVQYGLDFPFERWSVFRSWNRRIIASKIAPELVKTFRWIAIFYHPYDVDLIKALPKDVFTIFDWTEDWAVFHQDRTLAHLQREAVISSSMVLTVTEELRRRAVDWRGSEIAVHLLPNATAFRPFDVRGNYLPDELKSIPSPKIGFIGHVGPWFDAGLVVELASLNPEWQWILVGGVNDDIARILYEKPSIHCLGVKPPAELVPLMLACDVLVAPYVRNISGDATKLYDYLATGKPIVTSPCETAERLQPFVTICDGLEAWSVGIVRALSEDNTQLMKQRRNEALKNHWSVRVNKLLELISCHDR